MLGGYLGGGTQKTKAIDGKSNEEEKSPDINQSQINDRNVKDDLKKSFILEKAKSRRITEEAEQKARQEDFEAL